MNRFCLILTLAFIALFVAVTANTTAACEQLSFRSSLLYSAPLVADAAPLTARVVAYDTAPVCAGCSQRIVLRQRVENVVERVRVVPQRARIIVERVRAPLVNGAARIVNFFRTPVVRIRALRY